MGNFGLNIEDLEKIEEELRYELMKLSKELDKITKNRDKNYILFANQRKNQLSLEYSELVELYEYRFKEWKYIQKELTKKKEEN